MESSELNETISLLYASDKVALQQERRPENAAIQGGKYSSWLLVGIPRGNSCLRQSKGIRVRSHCRAAAWKISANDRYRSRVKCFVWVLTAGAIMARETSTAFRRIAARATAILTDCGAAAAAAWLAWPQASQPTSQQNSCDTFEHRSFPCHRFATHPFQWA